MRAFHIAGLPLILLAACGGSNEGVASNNSAAVPVEAANTANARPFKVETAADFDEPWAMTFLPDGRLLVTEKKGTLKLLGKDGRVGIVTGTPEVAYGGQGGLADIILHPDFANNARIYLSWAEAGGNGTKGAAVGRGTLVLDNQGGGRIDNLQVIWRQEPKVEGNGHFSHRLAFSPDGFLYISSGERQKFTPAQDMNQNLGKIVRLTDAGGIPGDNPFYGQGGIPAQIWSLGHRNVLGLAFDKQGRLWETEMGPKGGDELNLIVKGRNYGWPVVSNGDNYDGSPIPDHDTHPEFEAPKVWWNPSISPSSLMIYSGNLFPQWKGSAFIGALSGKALIRVVLDGDKASKADQWDMGARIREVEQGPDGAIWLLEDGGQGSEGRLLKLTPAK